MMAFYITSKGHGDTISCTILAWPDLPARLSDYLSPTAALLYASWLALQTCLKIYMPGGWTAGQTLSDGSTLIYMCNAWSSFITTIILFFSMLYLGFPVSIVTENIFGLITMTTVTSVCLSVWLFVKSASTPKCALSPCGNSGETIYDFYLGRELNPQLWGIDLKFFCELRPGIILWFIIDLCYVVEAYQSASLTPELLLITAFHGIYVADVMYYEDTVLTTLDITREGFGFMLTFGDMVYVPFVFSLQTRFLAYHPQGWSLPMLVIITMVNLMGYLIFRGANNEKDQFRQQTCRSPIGERVFRSAEGHTLLASGFWGWSRHPNYWGDILMATAWCTITGYQHVIPWYYLLYLAGTLVHRSDRDERKCKEKYRETWDVYTRAVPFKIIPMVY